MTVLMCSGRCNFEHVMSRLFARNKRVVYDRGLTCLMFTLGTTQSCVGEKRASLRLQSAYYKQLTMECQRKRPVYFSLNLLLKKCKTLYNLKPLRKKGLCNIMTTHFQLCAGLQ